MNTIEQKERRRQSRLNAYHLVKYLLATEQQGPVLASVKDISAGGLCLRTREKLPVSGVIQLHINFPQLQEAIPTTAKVIWVRKLGKVNRYEAGIQFLNIEQAFRDLIIKRIDGVNEITAKNKEKNKR